LRGHVDAAAPAASDATRILLQNGFKASTLAGGMLSRTQMESFWTG
jgi:phosphohistidine phosphatase SixA